uniref:Uncharacterized protein n=1 Tax=Rhizophora mucronata TaxID=61149 RepID=A0A2P2MY22_RHIMU
MLCLILGVLRFAHSLRLCIEALKVFIMFHGFEFIELLGYKFAFMLGYRNAKILASLVAKSLIRLDDVTLYVGVGVWLKSLCVERDLGRFGGHLRKRRGREMDDVGYPRIHMFHLCLCKLEF